MLQQLNCIAERGADARGLALEESWPLGIVVRDDDDALVRRRRPDAHGQNLFLRVREHLRRARSSGAAAYRRRLRPRSRTYAFSPSNARLAHPGQGRPPRA